MKSETPRRSLLDAFFDLKSGRGEPFASTSTSMQASSMSLKDGKFSIEVDIQVQVLESAMLSSSLWENNSFIAAQYKCITNS